MTSIVNTINRSTYFTHTPFLHHHVIRPTSRLYILKPTTVIAATVQVQSKPVNLAQLVTTVIFLTIPSIIDPRFIQPIYIFCTESVANMTNNLYWTVTVQIALCQLCFTTNTAKLKEHHILGYTNCMQKTIKDHTVHQVDIASGISIPYSHLGPVYVHTAYELVGKLV
jgi:hypothetical protein